MSRTLRQKWEASKKSFKGDLKAFEKGIPVKGEKVLRTVAFEVLESISIGSVAGGAHPITGSPGTPVDTSFARNSWWTCFGVPSGEPRLSKDNRGNKDGGSAMLQDSQNQLLAIQLGVPIYFLNNAEYLLALEYGHSGQAPRGFIRLTVKAAQALVEHAVNKHRTGAGR